jgi:hypothetical protein
VKTKKNEKKSEKKKSNTLEKKSAKKINWSELHLMLHHDLSSYVH